MDNIAFDVPVLLISFNRPETTCHVFDKIRKLKPAKLYIFSDAPRTDVPDDEELVNTCRCLLDDSQIDWNCKVERWYTESNMGRAVGISSAISWAFESSKKLIILEDDCLPHATFFAYCRSMLKRYEGNERVMHISGALWDQNNTVDGADHFFGLNANVSGWATWKRAWEKYDFWMDDFPEIKSQSRFQRLLGSSASRYWNLQFDKTFSQQKKSNWEIQWQYTIFKNYGITVLPNANLISNIDISFSSRDNEWNEGLFFETKPWKELNSEIEMAVNSEYEKQFAQTLVLKRTSERAGMIDRLISLLRLEY